MSQQIENSNIAKNTHLLNPLFWVLICQDPIIKWIQKKFRFSLCVFIIVKKTKKGRTITNVFQNKIRWEIWVDKGNRFYNKSIKSWLLDNDIEMYSTDNEEKSVVAERFIRILK